MRHTKFAIIVLCALSWQVRSQDLVIDEEEKKRLLELFGPPDGNTTTTEKINLSPNPVSRDGNNQSDSSRFECTTSDEKPGVCVLHYQCNPDTGTVIDDGATILDIRQKQCPHYLEVCCLESQTGSKPPPPVVPAAACGWSNPGAQAFRIVSDGTTAEFGDYPWMVAILKRTDGVTAWSQGDYLGGGSLIHPAVVLTGAHKVDGRQPGEIKCRAGEYDTQTDKEVYPHQERNVKKIIKHKDYYRPSVLNSIALLILESPYDLTNAPHIGVACVGRQAPPPRQRCQSMGWGKEFNDKDKYAVVLKKVELPIVDRKQCQIMLRRTRLGSHFQLHPSLSCAGGEAAQDTCTGDGGSPLVCPIGGGGASEPGRFAVFGMVAWGIGCGEAGVPGVYVHVPLFRDWIDEHVRAEGLDTTAYDY